MGTVTSSKARSALALLIVGLWAGAATSGRAQEIPLDEVGFAMGSADAGLTVVEFGDFACSACAQFFRDTWPGLLARYVDTGKVRWVMVPFELGFRNSEEGVRAAHCAASQGSFWVMHDALFTRRDEWVGERNPESPLTDIAASVGLDEESFRACYERDLHEDRRGAANDAARAKGVRGTPTFFIGDVVAPGALTLETFADLIERALESGAPVG